MPPLLHPGLSSGKTPPGSRVANRNPARAQSHVNLDYASGTLPNFTLVIHASPPPIEPLRSAEPTPVRDADHQNLGLIPQQRNGETARIRDLKAERQTSRAAMNEHRKLATSEDAPMDDPRAASPALRPPWQHAILQPPTP
jgi:hypothetical protein